MIKISVAMAAYKGERWIVSQLETIFNQTRLPDEVVICDDSPDDLTMQAIQSVQHKYPQIRYFRNRERLGITQNFSAAFEKCIGELIFISDQDDLWDHRKIELMAGFLESHPDCDLVFSNSSVVDENLKSLGYSAWQIQKRDPEVIKTLSPEKLSESQLIHPFAYAHDMAFRRTFLAKVFPFPAIEACHDFWLASLAAIGGGERIIPEELTSYRCHGNNYTQLQPMNIFKRWRQLQKSHNKDLINNAELYRLLNERTGKKSSLASDLEQFYSLRATGKWWKIPFSKYQHYGTGIRSLLRDIIF